MFYFGLSTFWPAPVTHVELLDRRVYMGEVTREEGYNPPEDFLAAQPAEVKERVAQRLADRGGT
ncbi:MAG: hypothetical protein GWO24_08555, partial [Akkermansiaceae bacterium]|nr:hypothetical protein [Akkermansiaceae bacterium]